MLESQTEQDLLQKHHRMEFWPTWKLYLPVIPYIVYESLRSIRIGSISSLGFGSIAAANPGIPLGGLVGESKSEILKHLDSRYVLKHFLIPSDSKNPKTILKKMQEHGMEFPVILKPNAGQRGQGVLKIIDLSTLAEGLKESNVDLLLQEFHPGPFEVGIFYYRLPSETKGKIFSITRKVFPSLIGDGCSTLGALVNAHPRYRIQEKVFRNRFPNDWDRILSLGEKFRLSEAGNHCQGTLFLDGSEWVTRELEEAIDRISSDFSGFYFGRYDIRFSSLKEFLEGKDLRIIELNGVTSESTNLYDPRFSFQERYSILFEQWKILFRIARESKGQKAGLWAILKALFQFYFGERVVSNISR